MKNKLMLFMAAVSPFVLPQVGRGQASIGAPIPVVVAEEEQRAPAAQVEDSRLPLLARVKNAVAPAARTDRPSSCCSTLEFQLCGQAKSKGDAAGPVYLENELDFNGFEAAEEEEEEEPIRMFENDIFGFSMSGWMYGTGIGNPMNNGGTRYNGPMTQNDQSRVHLNQMWVNLNRPLEDELSWGANFDMFMGNDYLASQSRGFEARPTRGLTPHWNNNKDFGFAIPQMYMDVGTTKYSIRVGHFFTPHGYMVVQAPGNFFNTLPWGFMMTNPFTHWGGMANANVTDNWSFMFGLVNGWDALDRPTDTPSYMGGVRYTFNDDKGFFSCNVITGQEPENRGAGYAGRTLITNILVYNFTDRFNFVFEQNVGWQRNRGMGTDCFYNFVPYLFYKINDTWRLGLRYEFYHDPFGFTAGARTGNPNVGPYSGNFQTVAAGINWAPNGNKNFVIRPELRYDWFNGSPVGGGAPFDAGRSNDQLLLMVGGFLQY